MADCVLPNNSDLTGVGIRLAIYVQSFLALVPPFLPTKRPLAYSRLGPSLAVNLLLLGFALVVASFVSAGTHHLVSLQGVVILNFIWLINLTVLYLLFQKYYSIVPSLPTRPLSIFTLILHDPLVLPYLGLFSSVGGLGLWLYVDLEHFKPQGDCTDPTEIWVFGTRNKMNNGAFNTYGVFVYILTSIPFVNVATWCLIILCTALLCWFSFTACCRPCLPARRRRLNSPSFTSFEVEENDNRSASTIAARYSGGKRAYVFATCGVVLFYTLLILAIEGTLHANAKYMVDPAPFGANPETGYWTLGQIMALVSLARPLRDLWRDLHPHKPRNVARSATAKGEELPTITLPRTRTLEEGVPQPPTGPSVPSDHMAP